MSKLYDLDIQIWEEDDSVFYHVIQNFEDEEPEVIAYGEVDTFSDAAREARNAVFTVLE